MKYSWINDNQVDLTIKLNDLCNTDCLHCYAHGSDRSFLDIELNAEYFDGLFRELYKKGVRSFLIGIVGGEITLLKPEDLKNTINSLYGVIDAFIKSVDEPVEVDISIISNFIFQKKYVDVLRGLLIPFNDSCSINLSTSYDIGLGRFKNPQAYSLWKGNCLSFSGDINLLITLNKKTCEEIYKVVSADFIKHFKEVSFQPMINFYGRDELTPSYELLRDTINYISSLNVNNFLMFEDKKPKYSVVVNNDGVVSCAASEAVKLYENKMHFNISEIGHVSEEFSEALDNQFKIRIKKTNNKICLGCDLFTDCHFGFEFFDSKIICPTFKIIKD